MDDDDDTEEIGPEPDPPIYVETVAALGYDPLAGERRSYVGHLVDA